MQPSYCYQQSVDRAGGWREHFYANEEMQTVEKSLLDELSRQKFRICFLFLEKMMDTAFRQIERFSIKYGEF